MKQDILQKYKQYVHGQHAKHNTRHTYLEHIRVMFKHIDKPYHQITQDDLDKYITHCQEKRKQKGEKKKQKERPLVSSCFTWSLLLFLVLVAFSQSRIAGPCGALFFCSSSHN